MRHRIKCKKESWTGWPVKSSMCACVCLCVNQTGTNYNHCTLHTWKFCMHKPTTVGLWWSQTMMLQLQLHSPGGAGWTLLPMAMISCA